MTATTQNHFFCHFDSFESSFNLSNSIKNLIPFIVVINFNSLIFFKLCKSSISLFDDFLILSFSVKGLLCVVVSYSFFTIETECSLSKFDIIKKSFSINSINARLIVPKSSFCFSNHSFNGCSSVEMLLSLKYLKMAILISSMFYLLMRHNGSPAFHCSPVLGGIGLRLCKVAGMDCCFYKRNYAKPLLPHVLIINYI
jgi:hypothetical protein